MSAGVYGVIAYTTGLRVQEIGIRVALGASPRRVAAVVLRDALIPLGAGLAVSIGAGLLLQRLLAGLLYGISGLDPIAWLTGTACLVAVGTSASLGPAWKAATADPLAALRSE